MCEGGREKCQDEIMRKCVRERETKTDDDRK